VAGNETDIETGEAFVLDAVRHIEVEPADKPVLGKKKHTQTR
jgi:hypothetical protein